MDTRKNHKPRTQKDRPLHPGSPPPATTFRKTNGGKHFSGAGDDSCPPQRGWKRASTKKAIRFQTALVAFHESIVTPLRLGNKVAQHVVEHAAVFEIFNLERSVDARLDLERLFARFHFKDLAGREAFGNAGDGVAFRAG